MSTTYTNDFGQSVTESQLSGLSSFLRITTLNGAVKTKESFFDGRFFTLYYYREPNETIESILENYITPGKGLVVIDKIPYPGGFTLEKSYSYDDDGTKMFMTNELFDANYDMIGIEVIEDLTTNTPDYERTKKYFYDRNVNPDDYLFDCKFNVDGSLFEIYYNNLHINSDEQDSEVYLDSPEDIATLRELTGISQELAEYYVSANVTPNF